MSVLRPAPVSLERFTSADGFLVAEYSDLPRLGRVYDDACDLGLTVVSHHTGREIVYAQADSKRDAEGDLLYDDFRPASPSDANAPTLRVFND